MKKLRAAIMGCGRISVCYEDAFNRLLIKWSLYAP